MSLLKSNLLVSKLIMNCSSVSFLCLLSLKLPFKMQPHESPHKILSRVDFVPLICAYYFPRAK